MQQKSQNKIYIISKEAVFFTHLLTLMAEQLRYELSCYIELKINFKNSLYKNYVFNLKMEPKLIYSYAKRVLYSYNPLFQNVVHAKRLLLFIKF